MEAVKNGFWHEADIIDTYTRADAIRDGVLIDVSNSAGQAGFTYPVAVTREVWDSYIVPSEESRQYGQCEAGRLWDVLWVLRQTIRAGSHGNVIRFPVRFIMKERQRRVIGLKSMCHGGDNGEPVITIMLPGED